MTTRDPWCPATRHGTASAYAHGCRCDDALHLANKAREMRRLHPCPLVPVLGTRRRIQALGRAGWTVLELSARSGFGTTAITAWMSDPKIRYVRQSTAAKVAAFYDELENFEGTSTGARNRAGRKGWAHPDQWIGRDMDNPRHKPGAPLPVAFDEVVVERLVAGRLRAAQVTSDERAAAVAIFAERGLTSSQIAEKLKANHRTIQRDLAAWRDS